jgi:hypothetical protein
MTFTKILNVNQAEERRVTERGTNKNSTKGILEKGGGRERHMDVYACVTKKKLCSSIFKWNNKHVFAFP